MNTNKLKLIDQEINKCNLCENLVEKFPNNTTIYYGKDNEIVLIGEAPANNGWRKSKMLWKESFPVVIFYKNYLTLLIKTYLT